MTSEEIKRRIIAISVSYGMSARKMNSFLLLFEKQIRDEQKMACFDNIEDLTEPREHNRLKRAIYNR